MDSPAVKRVRSNLPKRVLLLLTPRTYRARPFSEAAEKLGIDVVKAIDMQEQLAEYWHFPLGLDYGDIQKSVEAIIDYAQENPIGCILAVDDSGGLLAAAASERLGIPHNSPEAAFAARDKHRMRQLLKLHHVRSPESHLHHFTDQNDERHLTNIAEQVTFPCVVKPLALSGSRGVIRANDPGEFVRAALQLKRMLIQHESGGKGKPFLVEDFVPGVEVALEGILDDGKLHIMALFDKPDPLDGPYFEETIYVTPSRLSEEQQQDIFETAADAARALGLRQGPVHAELRLNADGAWLIEMAGRSIGGLCSHTLRFAGDSSLEELILRQAFDMAFEPLRREEEASGVMMLPIPQAGIYRGVDGCEAAEAVPLIEGVEITARINYSLKPLPVGDSYLGFIFARGPKASEVEAALREAHNKLHFTITPELVVLPPGT